MGMRRLGLVLSGTVAMLMLAGCAAGGGQLAGSTESPSPSPPSTGTPSEVRGIVALGHSGLTGQGTGGSTGAYSWATGDDPAVMSIYRRMLVSWPDTEGHVVNAAEGGAPASALQAQARRALERLPHPKLVIVQTIDNDIRCDGSDDVHVAEFGEDLREALRTVTTASPDSRILVIGQPGRPATYAAAIAADPSAVRANSGGGICDPFDASGALSEDRLATLTGIIEAYEAEQARVCGEFAQCTTDNGAAAAFEDRVEDLAGDGDWGHRNVDGHARLAEALWPVVAESLGG